MGGDISAYKQTFVCHRSCVRSCVCVCVGGGMFNTLWGSDLSSKCQ